MRCIAWAKAERSEGWAVGACPNAPEGAAAAADSSAPTALRLQS